MRKCSQNASISNEYYLICGLPWWISDKESACQCRGCGFDPWVGKMPWRKKWQPTPVFLPGKSHGQRSLLGYSPGCQKVGCDLVTKQQHGKPCIFICNLYEPCFMKYYWVWYHSFLTQLLGNNPNRGHTYIVLITVLLLRDLVVVIHCHVRNCPHPRHPKLSSSK